MPWWLILHAYKIIIHLLQALPLLRYKMQHAYPFTAHLTRLVVLLNQHTGCTVALHQLHRALHQLQAHQHTYGHAGSQGAPLITRGAGGVLIQAGQQELPPG